MTEDPKPLLTAEEVAALCEDALRPWSRHIEMARSQSEEAINALSIRFAGLAARLQTALSASRGHVHTTAKADPFKQAESQLGKVVQMLRRAQEGNSTMAARIASLKDITKELQTMSSLVANVATQTNILALNASIEAARAGEQGKGFAVVATEVKRLSQVSQQAGRQIAERIDQAEHTITTTAEDSQRKGAQDAQAVQDSATIIEDVLVRLRGVANDLVKSAEIMRDQNLGVQGEIAEVLVALQFQDRTSQILAVVVDGLRHLSLLLAERGKGGGDPGDVIKFLQGMKRRYTTAEQRQVHGGGGHTDAASELTFF